MPRSLPVSLSPHVCIASSPDLNELLDQASLPPLPYILQSFSPFPQVTARTTTLVSVPHAAFAVRFSELSDIETACKEDEEQRAVRTIDWISARIGHRCTKWVEEMEKLAHKELVKTPWWDELKRCAEGDHVPTQSEGWNHPVAVILAVSTTAPNPLQAITALHSRPITLPPWVDQNYFKYTVIIHPENSPLSDEEAGALFNAVKKQFGLHTYLLSLALPSPPPSPVPVPPLLPRLPLVPSDDTSDFIFQPPPTPMATPMPMSPRPDGFPLPIQGGNTIQMSEKDIQATARFTREFLVMSLIPWMERCVMEWNEVFSSNRRLPSRLFSSTRRLFGSPSPSPAPGAAPGAHARSNTLNTTVNAHPSSLPQQRRLAEFATILGDLKLAIPVWESLRKDGKYGSEILTLLLSPSPALQLHANSALMTVNPPIPEPSARSQIMAMRYAVRWEAGIGYPEFLDPHLEGEQWLVWAAGNAEEPPSALLLAHAALLSGKKRSRRRASLLYFAAANRLEKCGIKPLTMYFLRRAHDMYKLSPPKELSPSFWQAEGKTASTTEGFDAIMTGIEHPLGRLLYTTGDVTAAVRFFIGLLRGTPAATPLPLSAGPTPSVDKVFLDDFRVAFAHHRSVAPRFPDLNQLADLKLPFAFSVSSQTKLRLVHDISSDAPYWQTLEDEWRTFWTLSGRKDTVKKGGNASVDEPFFIDLALYNPLDVEVNLTNLTLSVVGPDPEVSPTETNSALEVETISDVLLGPQETRIVPVSIKSSQPTTLQITHVTFQFLSLLPITESLATRGRRLHQTLDHRLNPTYAPDLVTKVEVVEASHKLLVDFVDDRRLELFQGETKRLGLHFRNAGKLPIRELWMITNCADEIWMEDRPPEEPSSSSGTAVPSSNSIAASAPYRIFLGAGDSIRPGESVDISLLLHTEEPGEQELPILFVYRDSDSVPFHSVRAVQSFEVHPALRMAAHAQPSSSIAKIDELFTLDIEMENVATYATVLVTHLVALSPTWEAGSIESDSISIHPQQTSRLAVGIRQCGEGSSQAPVQEFVSQRLRAVLLGRPEEKTAPPSLYLRISPLSKDASSLKNSQTRRFIHSRRRKLVAESLEKSHPFISVKSHPTIFPLYHPYSVDVVAFWEIPQQKRAGHTLLTGLHVGASHENLKELLEEAETSKGAARNMYAETAREKAQVLAAIKLSEWNNEMDPLVMRVVSEGSATHDFSRGPHLAPVKFVLRNYSLTHHLRFRLKLNAVSNPPFDIATPLYHGRLTHQGKLQPMELYEINTKVCITRAGTYTLGGWWLEDEVLETEKEGRVRYRYLQQPTEEDRASITVGDVDRIPS